MTFSFWHHFFTDLEYVFAVTMFVFILMGSTN